MLERQAQNYQALDVELFRTVLSHFCSGVVIATSADDDQPVGLTAQSFASLSLEPPLVLFCVARTSSSWPRFRNSRRFCINVLGDQQRELALQFARSSTDKFSGIGWRWNEHHSPDLDGCLAYINCELEAVHDAGDHQIVIGRVMNLYLGDPRSPLVYYQGIFHRLEANQIA